MPRHDRPSREQIDKSIAATRKKAQERRQQRRCILLHAGDWVVFKLDSMNFVVTKTPDRSEDFSYFPSLAAAVGVLFDKRMEDLAKPGLQGIMDAIRQAKEEILASLASLENEG